MGKFSYYVLAIYLSPSRKVSNCHRFISEDLAGLLGTIDSQSDVLVCGDINIGLCSSCAEVHEFQRMSTSFDQQC